MRSYSISEMASFAMALVVLVLGALTLAFAIVKVVAGINILYGNTDPAFQFVVGFSIVILGSMLIPGNRRNEA